MPRRSITALVSFCRGQSVEDLLERRRGARTESGDAHVGHAAGQRLDRGRFGRDRLARQLDDVRDRRCCRESPSRDTLLPVAPRRSRRAGKGRHVPRRPAVDHPDDSRRSAVRPWRPAIRRGRRGRADRTGASRPGRRRPAGWAPRVSTARTSSGVRYALDGSSPSVRPCIAPSMTFSKSGFSTYACAMSWATSWNVRSSRYASCGAVRGAPISPPTVTRMTSGVEMSTISQRDRDVMDPF